MLGYDFTLLRCALPVGWSRDHRRWSEAVCSHPRQSTAPNAGQRDALLPILATDALAAAQRGRDRAPPSDGLGGMAGVRRAREGPRGGWLWFFGKNRRSAGRDRSPRSQRRCGMVDGRRGLRDTWIAIRHTRPDDRNGRRATVSLVAGRWSMVDGRSDQIAFDGLRRAGRNG
jgi:hypothetical protein